MRTHSDPRSFPEAPKKLYLREGEKVYLYRSETLYVLRLREGEPFELLSQCVDADLCDESRIVDAFPESKVWVYRLDENSGLTVDELKAKVRARGFEDLLFIGSVWVDEKSGRYQIYTGNLFLHFDAQWSSAQCDAALLRWGLKLKRRLGFGDNCYFVEPQASLEFDVFDWASILTRRREVKHCQPELVIARRSFGEGETSRKFIEDINRHWVHEKVRLDKAWKLSRGRGVKICVIDDGIDPDHPAFRDEFHNSSKIVGSIDLLDESNPEAKHLFSSEMHGTACASVAVSSDRRAWGAAPQAELLVARTKGLGSVLEAEAMYWAVQAGADVISCSWGPSDGDIDDPLDDFPSLGLPIHTKMAIEYATTKGRGGKGCLVLFAAGNGNEAVSLDQYASNPGVIAVGSVNREDRKTRYSDYGAPLFCVYPSSELRKTPYGYALDYGVTVADRLGAEGLSDDDYCALFGGTSASAPGVAGVAALALSLNPELKLGQLKAILSDSCDKIGPTALYDSQGYSQEFGYGRINAEKVAHEALRSRREPPADPMDEDNESQPKRPSRAARGYALHIGVDRSDPEVFANFPVLSGCVNDARALAAIFDQRGYETEILSNQSATRQRILSEIESLTNCAQAGDWVVISFAGHGSWVPDETGDEAFDEVLVCYDGFLIDDEIYDLFCEFDEGVRLVWIADCCHAESNHRLAKTLEADTEQSRAVREMRPSQIRKVYEDQRDDYLLVQLSLARMGRRQAEAAVLGLFACRDDQKAKEMDGRGLFTRRIESLYYKDSPLWYGPFVQQLQAPLGNQQDPRIEFYGKNRHLFEESPLFELKWKASSKPSEPPLPQPAPVLISDPTRPPLADGQHQVNGVKSSGADTVALLVHGEADRLRVLGPIQGRSGEGKEGGEEMRLRVVEGELQGCVSPAIHPWDRAYETLQAARDLEGIEFIEPDLVSDLYRFPHGDLSQVSRPDAGRGRKIKGSAPRSQNSREGGHGGAYLSSYPNPDHPNYHFVDHPFVWQLDDAYSQLRAAFDQIRKEVAVPPKNLKEAQALGLPLICHIDTGVLLNHPTLPRFFDAQRSRTFLRVGRKKDVSDYDHAGALVENQGHGHGTVSILAGDYVHLEDTHGEYRGYYGAFPYARVMSLKISENVVLLSGQKLARALRYAVKQGADVVTLSMAGAPSRAMLDAINEAYDAGVVVVAAAGNSWVKGGKRLLPKRTMYPARFRRVIGVTGATMDHTPYRVQDNKNWRKRETGGEFMQSCYGPKSVNGSNIAAYTPNIRWAGHFPDGALFERSGGGTSSATPQVAAAAAMWLFVHRKELPRRRSWRRVEMVRQALFRSADKSKNQEYGLVFGQGMLKAENALAIRPESLQDIRKAKRDTLGWFVFPKIVGQFFGRGLAKDVASDPSSKKGGTKTQKETILGEMLSAELAQLCLRDPSLFQYDGRNRFWEQLNQRAQKRWVEDVADQDSEPDELVDFARAVYVSPLASEFLKQQMAGMASIPLEASSLSPSSGPGVGAALDGEARSPMPYRSYRIVGDGQVLGRVAAYDCGVLMAAPFETANGGEDSALDAGGDRELAAGTAMKQGETQECISSLSTKYGYREYGLLFVTDPRARGLVGSFEYCDLQPESRKAVLVMEGAQGQKAKPPSDARLRWVLPQQGFSLGSSMLVPPTRAEERRARADRSERSSRLSLRGAALLPQGSRGPSSALQPWRLRIYGPAWRKKDDSASLLAPLPSFRERADAPDEGRIEGSTEGHVNSVHSGEKPAQSTLQGRTGLFVGCIREGQVHWSSLNEHAKVRIQKQSHCVLLIPGMFCGVEMTFAPLFEGEMGMLELQGRPDDLFLAYQSHSLGVRGIEEESDVLAEALESFASGTEVELKVIAHGRGGLIARRALDPSFRMAFVAAPLHGSTIFRSRHSAALLQRVTNLLGALPRSSAFEALLYDLGRWAQQIATSGQERPTTAEAAVQDEAAQLSLFAYGHELVPGSAMLEELARDYPLSQAQLLIASSLEPTASLLRQLDDAAMDVEVFGSEAHDAVVPVASAFARGEGLRPAKVYLDPVGKNHFFSYFHDDGVMQAIVRHLLDDGRASKTTEG